MGPRKIYKGGFRSGLAEIPPQDIYAKIVERCGDRRYWESWAKDVANIFQRVVVRIENLLDNPNNDALREWFDSFHAELRETINASITRDDAIDMMAQHILTRPIFESTVRELRLCIRQPRVDSTRQPTERFCGIRT